MSLAVRHSCAWSERDRPRLVVDDDKLRRLPVGGTFQASSQGTEALLTMLEQGFGLSVRREAGRVYIQDERGKHAD